MLATVLNASYSTLGRLVLAMIGLVSVGQVKAARVLVVHGFVKLGVGVQMQVAVHMLLLSYYSLNDGQSFVL